MTSQANPTVYERLCRHARTSPTALAVGHWSDGRLTDQCTYRELSVLVERVMAGLALRGVVAGDRVAVLLPNDLSFFAVVLAVLGMGAIAVPAPVPTVTRSGAFRERLTGILDDSAPRLLVTDAGWQQHFPEPGTVFWQDLRDERPDPVEPAGATGSPIAFLQYTSGSTGRPRGVVITHDALAAACRQSALAYAETAADVAVSWVPLYHDMGLITGVMRPLWSGYPSIVLRTEEFARSPACWPAAVDACRGTLSSAPNFAYELCVRRVPAEQARQLDLSCWRVARNAGEVVRAATIDRFVRHFAAAGFPSTSMSPSYGMAEATLTVTTCGPDVPPVRLSVLRSDWERGVVSPAPDGAPDSLVRELVSSGVPMTGTQVRIATADRFGEIQIRGPQLSAGYWPSDGRPPDDDWRPTGDVGFLHQGHLFVVGRIDDMIVHHGKNYYPSDVVAACQPIAAVRPGRLAVFLGGADPTGEPVVCLLAELRPDADVAPVALGSLARQVKASLASALDLYVTRVEFLAAGALPVTTSGKVRASEAGRRWAAGALPLLPQGRGDTNGR